MAVPTQKKSRLKQVILFSLLVLAVFLMDDPGQFHHSPLGIPLFIGLYMTIAIIALVMARKWLTEQPAGKERSMLGIALILMCIVPALVASNLVKYADYFLSDKNWKDITAVITQKSYSRSKRVTAYKYILQTADESMQLSSDVSLQQGDTVQMRVMRTMMGSTIGELKAPR